MANKLFIKDIILKKMPIIRYVKTAVIRKIRMSKSDYGMKVINSKLGNDLIANSLVDDKPVMISRLGSNELECISNYVLAKNKNAIWNESIQKRMATQAGFFPINKTQLINFSELYLDCLKNVDVMGVWYNSKEDLICKKYCPQANITELKALEPYYHLNPWSKNLIDKKVLVIHPFSESIKNQYFSKRDKLFNDKNVLPNFQLSTIKAVQSIANNKTDFNTWFDALDSMYSDILKSDFDIAIIGAGAYGLPLASFIKSIGKKAIHMGGASQILFGLKGNRWDNHKFISNLYNEYWIRPSLDDKPMNYKKVEDGCYW